MMAGPTQAPEIHICLVSDQLLPNVIPVFARHPLTVHLVVSSRMRSQGERLARLLVARGYEVRVHDQAPDTGLRDIARYASRLAVALQAAGTAERLILNATGGTKPMAMVFVDIFRGVATEILYTDTAHGRLEFLEPGRAAEPIPDVLDIPTYLDVQGMRYQHALSDDTAWVERSVRRATLSRYLALNAAALGDFIGALNRLARLALDPQGESLIAPQQSLNSTPYGRWRRSLERLTGEELLRWRGEKVLEFTSAESARYLSGGWLEEYAWHVSRDHRPHDTRIGVRGTWIDTQSTHNELDVLVVHRNRMLVIECKTLRLDRNEREEQTFLYKLDSLSEDVQGLFGQTLLISARPPTLLMRDRASHLGIRIFGPKDLPMLGAHIHRWLNDV